MEVDILEGARNLILRHRPFLYVENDAPERHGVLTHYIISLGIVVAVSCFLIGTQQAMYATGS